MSFRLRWTVDATETFQELQRAAELARQCRTGAEDRRRTRSSKQEGLFKQVANAVRLLAENPRHPGLNTHEFDSIPHPFDEGGKVFEAYAQNRSPGAYRIFWCYGPSQGEITVVVITPHP